VLRVGLLLPLSGTEDAVRVGVDLRAGAQLANEEAGSPFELIEADIGADYGDLPVVEAESCRMLRVAEQTRRLAAADDVVAIIGPVYSSDCVVAAVVADGAGVPLIAPLAEQGGLERAGSTLLQLGMPPGVQARALAEYATRDLELVTLAVVSPLTDYGWAFEREFARAAQANGGVVIHADWYVPEVTRDFRRVFGDLRRVAQGLQGSVPGPWLDTRTPPVAPGLTDSLGGSAAPSDAPLPAADGSVDNGDPIAAELPLAGPSGEAYGDTSEVFVDALDGLVIVAESFADAQIIAPQVQYHRLRTQVLGNDVWYEPDLVQQMRPADRAHFEGAVVVTGRSTDDDAGQRFAAAFRRRYRREPGLAAAGHCAARLLVEAWRRGHRTRSAIGEWLAAAATSGDGAAIASCGGRAGEPTVLRIDEHGHFRRVGGGGAE